MKNNKKITKWIDSRRKKTSFIVKKKEISSLIKWKCNKKKISHISKKFFQILGIRIKSNFFNNETWDQPLISQNEVGILGIIRRLYGGKIEYLMQAKSEPGNINKVQLSPTVQATKSNYSQVHRGKKVKYLNYFAHLKKKKTLVNSLQTEQGGRYLFKYNRNLIVNTNSHIKLDKNYMWLSKQDIINSANKNNLLNMDSISVFSCAIKKNINEKPKSSSAKIQAWFNKLKKKYFIKRKVIPLSKMKSWNYNKKNISHKNKTYFSIIGLNIKTNSREISEWDQPIIQELSMGLSGFIIKKIHSTLHYLVRFSLKPGIKNPSLTCTVRTSDEKNCLIKKNYTSLKDNDLMKFFLKEYFVKKNKGTIIYSKIQSDEGGRFYHSQSRNMIVQVQEKEIIRLNDNYTWMSHNQVLHFIKKGIFNIEARILFACFNIKNIL